MHRTDGGLWTVHRLSKSDIVSLIREPAVGLRKLTLPHWGHVSTDCIIGYSLGCMNLLHNIAVYGTLCKELDIAFRCPYETSALLPKLWLRVAVNLFAPV